MSGGGNVDAMNVVEQRDAVALRLCKGFRQHGEGPRISHGDAGVERERAQYGNFAPGQLAMIAVRDEQDALQLVFRKNREAGKRDDTFSVENSIQRIGVPESLVAQIILRVEETLGTDNEAYGAITDASRHLRGGWVDMSFGRDGLQDIVILIEQRQPCDVGADEASRPADDRPQ